MFLKKKEIKTASLQWEMEKKMMTAGGGDGSEPFSCQLQSYHLTCGCEVSHKSL